MRSDNVLLQRSRVPYQEKSPRGTIPSNLHKRASQRLLTIQIREIVVVGTSPDPYMSPRASNFTHIISRPDEKKMSWHRLSSYLRLCCHNTPRYRCARLRAFAACGHGLTTMRKLCDRSLSLTAASLCSRVEQQCDCQDEVVSALFTYRRR